MNKLKTHRIILYLALLMMLVFAIILIVNYISGNAAGVKVGWIGEAAMCLATISQMLVIVDIKKREGK